MNQEKKPLIVVGIDGGDPARVALERAVAMAVAWDAELHAVYVTDLPPTVMYLTDSVPIDMLELARLQRDGVWEVVAPLIEAAGRPIEKIDLDGYPADRLVEHCEATGADLLVLGTRGRGRIAATFLGSTSMRALEHAPCDVLIAKNVAG